MVRSKLMNMIRKLSKEQVDRLNGITKNYLDLNTEVENTAPKSCPCYDADNTHFIKR